LMKRKLTKILGVGLAFVVITSLFGFALPMSADPGDVIWEPFPIPPQGAPTYVMQDSIMSTGPIESIGNTIYVAAWDDDITPAMGGVQGALDDPVGNPAVATTEIQIYRSVDGGRTYARTAYSVDTEVVNSANPGFPITDICIIDANTVYVSNGWDIFKTIDGGANWIPLTNLFNYGATWTPFPPAGVITSIDVGVIGTDIYVFAGTNDGFAAGQDGGGAFVCWEWALGMPWEQLRIDTNRPPTPGGWGAGTADVFDIRADPNNFATTQAILAVAHYDGTGGLFADPQQFTVVTSKHLGHEWNSYVGDAALLFGNVAGNYVTDPYRAEMWLPENFDYHLLVTSGMEYFVGIASGVATEGDVYQIIGGVPNAADPPVPGSYPFDLNIAGPLTATDVSGLDGAGVSGAATLLAAGDPPAPFVAGTPTLFRSATNGALWFPNAKGPTGNVWPFALLGLYPANAMPFVTVADDFATSGTAWIATQGFDCGVSLTEDFGSTSNTIGLIATDIDLLQDFSVNADGSLMFLATDDTLAFPPPPAVAFTPASNTNSIWRFDDFWERVWSDTLSPLGAGDEADWVELTSDGALFTLDADGLAGAYTIFRSLDLGQSFLPQLTPVGGNDGANDVVTSWAPINATTVVCGCAAGEIDRTTNNGVIWAEIPTAVIAGPIMNVVIEPGYVDPGAVLAADALGNVGFSPDGGLTWIPLGNTGLPAGNTYLAFDANYATTGISYATSAGGGVARTGFPVGLRIDLQGQPGEFPVAAGSGIISTLGPDGESVLYVADGGGGGAGLILADGIIISGGVAADNGTITVLTGSVLVTPTGTATIAGVGVGGTLAITPGMGAIPYTLPLAADTLLIDATANATSGFWTSVTGNATAALGFDANLNVTFGAGPGVGNFPFSLPDTQVPPVLGGAAAVSRALDPRAPVIPGVMPYWETTGEGLTTQVFADGAFGQNFLWASNGVGSTTLWELDALGLDIGIYHYTDTLATRVVPTAPADGDSIMAPTTGPWTVTLSWTGLSGATDYQVQIALNATFTAPTFCGEVLNYIASSTSATYVLVPGCSNNATYFWRVRAASSIPATLGFGAPVRSYWSLPQSFTTSPGPPARINIIVMPPAGAQNVAINTTFQWEEVWGAQHYQWELATDSTFATILDSQSPIDPFCQPASSLDYDTTYAWRVRAMADTTPLSDWVRSSFHTEIAPTDPVDVSDVTIPPVENITPIWIWVIVAVGAVLVIVVLILIWLTRQGR